MRAQNNVRFNALLCNNFFVIKHKQIVTDKLIPFGFEQSDQGFAFSKYILDGQFDLKLFVKNGELFSCLTEREFGNEYVLHLIADAQGEFVGKVKAEYNCVLDKFIESCCETNVFRSEQACAVIEYVRKSYGDELQYLWEKFPENAVFKRKDTQTRYAVLLVVSRRKIGFDSDEKNDIIYLRMRPDNAEKLIDGKVYLPGYHMNKKNWFAVVLDGSAPTEEIFRRIDDSYSLANKKCK